MSKQKVIYFHKTHWSCGVHCPGHTARDHLKWKQLHKNMDENHPGTQNSLTHESAWEAEATSSWEGIPGHTITQLLGFSSSSWVDTCQTQAICLGQILDWPSRVLSMLFCIRWHLYVQFVFKIWNKALWLPLFCTALRQSCHAGLCCKTIMKGCFKYLTKTQMLQLTQNLSVKWSNFIPKFADQMRTQVLCFPPSHFWSAEDTRSANIQWVIPAGILKTWHLNSNSPFV